MDINYLNSLIENDENTTEVLSEVIKILGEIMAPAEILFAKVKPNAIIPTKRDEDAGYDMYACVDEDAILINPHETMLIPTGIASCFSSKYWLKLAERGSTGTKGIAQRCGVIDSGYRNEIQAPITNVNEKPILFIKDIENLPLCVTVKTKTKNMCFRKEDFESQIKDSIIYPMSKAITQGILVELPKTITKEISYSELKEIPSERNLGAWGSSNK